jgi:hypothetical protein
MLQSLPWKAAGIDISSSAIREKTHRCRVGGSAELLARGVAVQQQLLFLA